EWRSRFHSPSTFRSPGGYGRSGGCICPCWYRLVAGLANPEECLHAQSESSPARVTLRRFFVGSCPVLIGPFQTPLEFRCRQPCVVGIGQRPGPLAVKR